MTFDFLSIFFLIIINLSISLIVSLFLVPKIITIGELFNILDEPDQRRINLTPKTRIGGIAIYIGFLFSIIFFFINI